MSRAVKFAYGIRDSLCEDILSQQHVLIAGTTGSGKSTLEKAVLHTGFTYPIWWVYIDFKRVELKPFSYAPNCLGYAQTRDEAIPLMRHMVDVMMERFKVMEQNRQRKTTECAIWIVIDETAEYIRLCGREGLNLLDEIGRLGRAANIHLLLCTQNPSRGKTSGLTAEIQQNVTAAMALRCKSAIESRQVIGVSGAERLPQYGEGLWYTARGLEHVKIPFVTDEEVDAQLANVRWADEVSA